MKNIPLLSYVLFASITIHCMEQKKQITTTNQPSQSWQNIDISVVTQSLHNNYKNYLKTGLEKYKNNDDVDLEQLVTQSNFMIGQSNGIEFFKQTHDEDHNFFMHIAVLKRDLPAMRYLLTKNKNVRHQLWMHNAQQQSPFELCIAQLLPESIDNECNQKSTSLAILKEMIDNMIEYFFAKGTIIDCIQKIINLELACRAHASTTTTLIETQLLDDLLAKASTKEQPLSLATFYQDVTETKTGNTKSHFVVEQQNADELYELINKDHVSPHKNKEGLTVLDLALKKFRLFTQNSSLFDTQSEEAAHARCCLFMLYKYILLKQQNTSFTTTSNCCDQHPITEK
jgi:hypothetical protein